MMENRIRIVVVWLVFIVITTFIHPDVANAAVSGKTDDTTVDFVLVLDCSGSMNQSDSNGMSLVAAELLIDLLPEENTRVGIIGFGKKEWDNFTKVEYPLTGLDGDTDKKRNEAKEAIESLLKIRETSDDKTYTTVGYAIERAQNMLEEAGSQDGKASIILLSDGRLTITGELRNEYDSREFGYDKNILFSKRLESAIEGLKEHEWPVYSMELAADLNPEHKNHTNDKNGVCQNYQEDTKGVNIELPWLLCTGQYQMQHISKETGGGDKITVFSNEDIEKAFGNILGRFYDVPTGITEHTIMDGKASVDIEIEEMTAEMNIVILEEYSDSITSIELTTPDGETTEYTQSKSLDTRKVLFGKGEYVLIKLLQPKAGHWNVTVYGKNGIVIGVMVVPMRQVKLALGTVTDIEDVISKGTNVNLYASFMYNNSKVTSDKFYRENTCELIVEETGQRFQMNGDSESSYSYVFVPKISGTYTLYAEVASERFLGGKQRSGKITINVDNRPVTIKKDALLVLEMNLNSKYKEFNYTDYFEDKDGVEEINCDVRVVDPTSELKASIKGQMVYIESGSKSSPEEGFKIILSAKDGYMKETAEQELTVIVKNKEMTPVDDEDIYRTIEVGREEKINLNDYFIDEDDIPINFEIKGYQTNNGIVEVNLDDLEIGIITLKGLDDGKVSFDVVASDSSDASVQYVKKVEVGVKSWQKIFWEENWGKLILGTIIALIVLLLVIGAKPRRNPYGVWKVNVNGTDFSNKAFHQVSLENAQGNKYDVLCLLNKVGISKEYLPCDENGDILQSDICLQNTNGLNQGVKLVGKYENKQLDVKVKVDGYPEDDRTLKRGIKIKNNQKISLEILKLKGNDGYYITIERIS